MALVRIAMVGKYTDLADAYLSVTKACEHAAIAVERRLIIDWVESEHLESSSDE